MRQLVLYTVLGSNCGCVTSTDDDNLTALCGLDSGVECGLCAGSELFELEDTCGTVPQNGLGLADSLLVEFDRLLSAVKTHPAIWDAVLVLSVPCVGILVELVGGDIVNGQDNLDVVLLGLLCKILDGLAASLVE